MPVRGIGVSDKAAGAGVAEYRLRERTVDGGTYAEQYLVPQRWRVPSFRGMAGDWWSGNAAAVATKCSLANLTGSSVLVAVRSCVVHVVPWASPITDPVEFRLHMQNADPTVGAAVLTKVSVGTGPDAAQTSNASVELRSRHSSDNSTATAITLTLGAPIMYRQGRAHTTTTTGGQMVSARGVYPSADFNLDMAEDAVSELVAGAPIILRAGWSLAVSSTAASTNGTQMAVTWLWDEYTLP